MHKVSLIFKSILKSIFNIGSIYLQTTRLR